MLVWSSRVVTDVQLVAPNLRLGSGGGASRLNSRAPSVPPGSLLRHMLTRSIVVHFRND